jgi:transcriptional regulator with XRE-family HTH domain
MSTTSTKPFAEVENSTQLRKVPPLRGLRVARGLSLRDVAERAQVDIGQLSRAERGLAGISIPVLRRIAHVLELRELYRILEPFDRGRVTKSANDPAPVAGGDPTNRRRP